MKRSLIILGFVSSFIISIGMLMSFLKWSGFTEVRLIGFGILAYLLAPMLTKVSFASDMKYLGITSAVSMFLLGDGMVFKYLHLPSANIQIVLGTVLFCFYCLPVVFTAMYQRQKAV